jgi:hypothetical protein
MLRRKINNCIYFRYQIKLVLFFLIFIAFHILPQNLYCQIENFTSLESKLDSMLILGEVSKVKQTLYDLYEQNNTDENFIKIQEAYTTLFEALNHRSNFNEAEMLERLDQYLKFEPLFEIEQAGKNANLAYRNFVKAYKENNFNEAIKFYGIAYFLKDKFINSLWDKYKFYLSKYQFYYSKSEFEKSLSYLRNIKMLTKERPIFNSQQDTLNVLWEDNYEKFRHIDTYNKEYKTTKIFDSKFQYSFSSQLLYNMEIENVIWPAVNGTRNYDYKIKSIPEEFGWGIIFNADYGITNNLSFGFQFRASEYLIHYIIIPENLFQFRLKHNVSAIGIYLYSKFYFRDKFGARPFISFGAGSVSITRHEVKLFQAYGTATKQTKKSIQAFTDLGIDYIFESYPSVVYGFFVSSYFYPDENGINSKYNFAISLKVGVHF